MNRYEQTLKEKDDELKTLKMDMSQHIINNSFVTSSSEQPVSSSTTFSTHQINDEEGMNSSDIQSSKISEEVRNNDEKQSRPISLSRTMSPAQPTGPTEELQVTRGKDQWSKKRPFATDVCPGCGEKGYGLMVRLLSVTSSPLRLFDRLTFR
jgi:hypothetical protein